MKAWLGGGGFLEFNFVGLRQGAGPGAGSTGVVLGTVAALLDAKQATGAATKVNRDVARSGELLRFE